jgi:hypothetical protein
MKRLVMAALVFAALAGGAGCGSSPASKPSSLSESGGSNPTSLLITWSSDGNPLVPVCNGATQNCKSDITVLDKTTGAEVTIPITSSSYTAPNSNDSYAVRVNGFDGQGNSIASEYEVVPAQ